MTTAERPRVGQKMISRKYGRVYGEIYVVRGDDTYVLAEYLAGALVDSVRSEGTWVRALGRSIGREALTWQDDVARGYEFVDELPDGLTMPEKPRCWGWWLDEKSSWAKSGWKFAGKGAAECPRCGKVVSVNALARASHEKACAKKKRAEVTS